MSAICVGIAGGLRVAAYAGCIVVLARASHQSLLPQAAAPWPKIAGDMRNSGNGPSCRATGRVAWSLKLSSQAFRTAVVGPGERVYAACVDGAVYCVDGDTGKQVWKIELPSRPLGAPAITDSGIFVVPCGYSVYGLDTADGSTAWKWKSTQALSSSIGLGENGVVFAGAEAGQLVCLDGRTGKRLWAAESERPLGGCAAVGGRRVLCTDMHGIVAFRASDGEKQWTRSLTNRTTTLPAIGANDNIYTLDGVPDRIRVLALTVRGDVRWSNEISDGYYRSVLGPSVGPDNLLYVGLGRTGGPGAIEALDGGTGRRVWNRPLSDSVVGPPIITGDRKLLVCCSDGSLHSFDAATGDAQWVVRMRSRCISAPALGAHDRIYFGSEDDNLIAIE